jgi:hypothetical protein
MFPCLDSAHHYTLCHTLLVILMFENETEFCDHLLN